MAQENGSSLDVPSETVGVPRRERTFGRAPLVRAVARVPLPIRAKQLFGSVAVAALLALVAVLGLVALGQSNSRGTELRTLQQQGGYEQLLLTDATQLKLLLDFRLARHPEERPSRSEEPDLHPAYDPASYQRGFLSALDQQIGNEFTRLCLDAGGCPQESGSPDCTDCTFAQFAPHLPLTLEAVAPSLSAKIADSQPLFIGVSGSSGEPQAPFQSEFVQSDRRAASFAKKLAALTGQTKARATALVAGDRRSYRRSRDLLIGAGAGSRFLALALGLLLSDSDLRALRGERGRGGARAGRLFLALALGLLLSDSVLVPLRKTQRRLAAIATGDFSGRVEVPNRDEIGALAADVNRMSDELQRLYQELKTGSRHKSDFLATMSHELRTPLNAIIGFSEVLHEQMFGELNERQLAYIDDVLA